jgi:hypothetical protein
MEAVVCTQVAYWLGPEEVSKKNDVSIGNPSVHANHFTAE